jgi:hypothetical protein
LKKIQSRPVLTINIFGADDHFSVQKPMLELLDGWLRHKSDMVNFEAARAICEMKGITAPQLTKAIAGKLLKITLVLVSAAKMC